MNAKQDSVPPVESQRPKTPNESIAAIISSHAFLQGVNPTHGKLFQDCAMLSHFAPGELIFREGDPANRFYLIHTGKVALETHVRDRGTVLIQTIGGGDI